jgi:NADH:ubiquinone oxidoreductase subunit 6 (subunit J)
MIDLDMLTFLVVGCITLLSAVYVLRSREIIHSVMFLAMTFVGVACMYLLLNAEYVAIVQILIYAGAVTVLILFPIMLTKRRIMEKGGRGP